MWNFQMGKHQCDKFGHVQIMKMSFGTNFQWWIDLYILWTSSNSKKKLANKLKVNTYVTTLVLGSWPKVMPKKKNELETFKARKRLKHIGGMKKKHSWNSWEEFPLKELGIH